MNDIEKTFFEEQITQKKIKIEKKPEVKIIKNIKGDNDES